MEICHTSEQVPQIFPTCSALSSSLSSSDQGSPKFAVVRKGLGVFFFFFFLGYGKDHLPEKKESSSRLRSTKAPVAFMLQGAL